MRSLKTVFKAIKGLVLALWGREPEYEQQKDKEIEYERNQWGFPQQ